MERTESARLEPSQGTPEQDAYLARCQVDTPERLVRFVWEHVNARRPNAGAVVDFGCGDARFSRFGVFDSYAGFEIDPSRGPSAPLTSPRTVNIGCAFESDNPTGYSVCVGNPPYVRHHDLDSAWLKRVETRLSSLVDYRGDGRSNAYIYFLWLALASVAEDGLVALIIPYEWVSRPASAKVRRFIKQRGWDVDVYHIENAAFERVLTTACLVVVDKRASRGGAWRLFNVTADDTISPMRQATGSAQRQLAYEDASEDARAIRGLSPGGKDVFVLTEGERIHFQLKPTRDVVPAVTSFRHLEQTQLTLTETLFRTHFVHTGHRCWLINAGAAPSPELQAYLDQIPAKCRTNYTCTQRKVWWQFSMPEVADVLYASGFKGARPKMFRNIVGAVHVGGIHGIHFKRASMVPEVLDALLKLDFSKKVVALSKGFLKVEVRQMNTVLNAVLKRVRA